MATKRERVERAVQGMMAHAVANSARYHYRTSPSVAAHLLRNGCKITILSRQYIPLIVGLGVGTRKVVWVDKHAPEITIDEETEDGRHEH